jgi:hypothetical protein
MNTDLEGRLREALHEDAQHAQFVNPDRPRIPEVVSISEKPRRARSNRRIVAFAAAIALVVAAAAVIVRSAEHRKAAVSITPSTLSPAPGLVTIPPGPKQLFTGLAPGGSVPLPYAPIEQRDDSAAIVWTGAELVMWSGYSDGPVSQDGATLDLASGTWRRIAPAPIDGREGPATAWTGREMIVVGGQQYPKSLKSAAAYSPASDTWRQLPDAPIVAGMGTRAVWDGAEVLLLGGASQGGIGQTATAAYNPATNEWRRLAFVPRGGIGPVVWTGRTILTTTESSAVNNARPSVALTIYDPITNTWSVDRDRRYAAIVGIPERDGTTRTALALPVDTGAPVDVLDDAGKVVGHLPAQPGNTDRFGAEVDAFGLWVNGEAMFWITGASDLFPNMKAFALNPATKTWRSLPDGVARPVMAIGNMLLITSEAKHNDVTKAVLYRPPNA